MQSDGTNCDFYEHRKQAVWSPKPIPLVIFYLHNQGNYRENVQFGGGEGNRTPVRKHSNPGISERS
jgi:hypothetical protein